MLIQGEKHKEIGSTQILLKDKFEMTPDLPHGYYVIAERQSVGKGRNDRAWISGEGNLLVSVLLRNFPFSELTWIPHWVSVCVLKSLVDLGVDDKLIQLKWPNDLWIHRSKKIAGILCEKRGNVIVVGIGLNLATTPVLENQEVGSISELGISLKPVPVLERILFHLSNSISVTEVQNFYEVHALFKQGDPVEWLQDLNAKKQLGFVQGLGKYGELLVKINGSTQSLFVEDVRSVRGV